MSALGHKRKIFASRSMSALPRVADEEGPIFVPRIDPAVVPTIQRTGLAGDGEQTPFVSVVEPVAGRAAARPAAF
jgi:hypothetical protein